MHHLPLDALKLNDAAFVLFGSVITNIDMLEIVAALAEPVEHD